MFIFKKTEALRAHLAQQKKAARSIGFIPTMGALHNGHKSLLSKSREQGDYTVCSIFVNPTQFNDQEDFIKYPKSVASDIILLEEAGCDVLFLPEVEEIYPNGSDSVESFDFGYLETILEGAHRPNHFRGVGQVVGRLLDITEPDRLYMGQKDFQQCMIVKRLLELKKNKTSVEMIIGTTVREEDGLAMSSRNRRLSEPQRALSGIIYQCLVSVQNKNGITPFDIVQKECIDLLRDKGFEPDYVALANANTLEILNNYTDKEPMVVLIAAKLGNIRLIDNILLN